MHSPRAQRFGAYAGRRLSLLVAGCLLAAAASAHATGQNQAALPRLTDLTLDQLGDVEVTSVSKRPEEIWRTAVAIHVITSEEIRRSGVTSIPEVLRLAPGIEVARIDSDHWAVGVRGFGDQFSKSLLVLIDGRSIYTPLFAGMYWPAHDVLLDDVERIEVIRGPGGTIWGANAVNGVINIITKPATDTRGTLVYAGAGNIDRGAGAFRYGAGNGTTFNYRAYAKGVNRGGQYHADGANFDEWWTGQAGFRMDWKPRTADVLTLQGDVSTGEHGQRVNSSSFSPPSLTVLDGHLDASGVNVRARWQRELANGRGFRLQAYYDRTSWLAPHFGEKRSTVDLDFVHNLGFAGRHVVTAGAGARVSPSAFIQTVPALDFSPRRSTDSIYSAFAQDEIELVRSKVWLTAGSKVERNNYTGFEVQPGVRVLWTPRSGQSLWSAVTRGIRTPSRIEAGIITTAFAGLSGTTPVFLRVSGNPNFSAERLVGYEAGYRTRLGSKTYLDVAAFHDRHRGLSSFGLGQITIERSPPPLHAIVNVLYVNGVDGTSDGFELAPEWQPFGWWRVRSSYSFVRFDLATAPSSVDVNAVSRYVGSSPHHQARVQSQFNVARRGEMDLTYRWVSALPAQSVPAYHAADARLGWTVSPTLDVALVGQNLLSPQHAEFGHTPGPAVGIARSVQVELRWRKPDTRP